ncbi:MAG: hypothetical protein ACFFD2_15045 [Promethearchaeota archaeon]
MIKKEIVAPVLVHERDLTIIQSDLEIVLMFALAEYDKRRHEQYREGSYEFFSKIVWPVILIQTGSENYIGIDGLSFFDLDFKKTKFLTSESPLFSILGRQINDHQSRLNLLSRCIEELNTSLKEDLKIKGIIGPEILHGLVPLIKLATDKIITSVKLEPNISTDNLIVITNQYNQALKNIEETISKWHSFQQVVEQKIEKWYISYARSSSLSIEQNQLKEKYDKLNKKILDKIWDCRNEFDYLLHWSISGQTLNLVVPITEVWISMYLAGIILPDKTKKTILLPPSILSEEVNSNRRIPIDSFHTSFNSILRDKIETILESQSRVAQKIKASCLIQNLFVNEDANKLMARGFNRLREKHLIEDKYLEDLEQKWQRSSQNLKNKI